MDYYEKLSEEATAREQKALWRVRRRQLDVERMSFLQQEEALLAEELATNPTKMAATAALQVQMCSLWYLSFNLLSHWPDVVLIIVHTQFPKRQE